MSYYTGTAASLTALRTALLTHAQTDGWVLTGDVLSKAGVFFRIQETATTITLLGCESNAVLNPAPNVVTIGRIFERSGYATQEIVFPATYHLFGFAQELYFVVNYSTSFYQWLAFGKSTVAGLPGQGGWCGATCGSLPEDNYGAFPIVINAISGGAADGMSGALFWATTHAKESERSCWVNHGLDAHGWTYNGLVGNAPIGIRHNTPLIGAQPNGWNADAVLLPLRCYKERPSFKSSLIADLQYARILRIDNLAPAQIITLGVDKWMVFPWYAKDTVARNGGTSVNHTGTFGWAIRYEGA